MNLTDEEKQELLGEHFYYEVKMLNFTATKLAEFTRTDIWNRNMALETFLLHARNLREFFYRDSKQHETDARAYEFVKERNKWEKARPGETEWINKVRERANTELAHLTYRRYVGTPPEKEWKYHKIQKDLLKVVKIFLDHLPKKYIDKRLQEIEQMCLHVDTTTDRQGGLSTPVATTSTVSTTSSLEANSNYSRYRHKRSLELLREDAKQVAKQLKDLPVNAWAERNNALMRLANVVVELIDRVEQKEKREEQSSDNR